MSKRRLIVRSSEARPSLPEGPAAVALVNPQWQEIEAAVRRIQKRCRTGLLDLAALHMGYESVESGASVSYESRSWSSPPHYTYGTPGSLAQVVRISSALVGVYVGRQIVQPGAQTFWPIATEASLERPYEWLRSVLMTFGDQLSDVAIHALRKQVRETAARRRTEVVSESSSNAPGPQLPTVAALCRGVWPTLVSERAAAVQLIRDACPDPHAPIRWSTIKRLVPGAARRFEGEFLAASKNGILTPDALSDIASKRTFELELSLWSRNIQRVTPVTQLVFQIQVAHALASLEEQGGAYLWLADRMRGVGERQHHIGDEETIGWLRVFVDDAHRLAFVDEVQSDMMECLFSLRKQCPEAATVAKSLSRWSIEGLLSIQAWARQLGYRVATHSRVSSLLVPGKTRSERKWNTYYKALIDELDLREEYVAGYPSVICVGKK